VGHRRGRRWGRGLRRRGDGGYHRGRRWGRKLCVAAREEGGGGNCVLPPGKKATQGFIDASGKKAGRGLGAPAGEEGGAGIRFCHRRRRRGGSWIRETECPADRGEGGGVHVALDEFFSGWLGSPAGGWGSVWLGVRE
jgi:hypothetical protein